MLGDEVLGFYLPATPQRPNPELRIVDPDLMSATAASAESYNFELDPSTPGTLDDFLVVVAASSVVENGLIVEAIRDCVRGRYAILAKEILEAEAWNTARAPKQRATTRILVCVVCCRGDEGTAGSLVI